MLPAFELLPPFMLLDTEISEILSQYPLEKKPVDIQRIFRCSWTRPQTQPVLLSCFEHNKISLPQSLGLCIMLKYKKVITNVPNCRWAVC
jgi:hypothetical protein